MLCTLPSANRDRALFSARKPAPQRSSSAIKARLPRVVVRASQEDKSVAEKLALPAAAVLGAALLFAATPDEALAARSGGRVGGSSGFSQRARAPAPSRSPPVVNNYYSAPPVFGGGFGFGLPFFPGFGIGYGVPVFGFGLSSIFNFILLSFFISIIWTVITNFTNSSNRGNSNKSDDEVGKRA